MKVAPTLAVLALLVPAALVPAQAGSGVPGSYFTHTSALIGFTASFDYGIPGLATSIGVFSFSDGYGPSFYPGLGNVWLDTSSPVYGIIVQYPDATGNIHFDVPVPNDPGLFGAGPFYVNGFVADASLPPPQWSLTKTVSVSFDTQDGYRPVGNLAVARSMHTAVSLSSGPGDDETRVLFIGGGTGSIILPQPNNSLELYNPMKRAFEPGPNLLIPRAKCGAVRLQDGRVLIAGGVSTGGVVTETCGLYDPATNAITITGFMNFPRVGHAMTLLPSGEVLVTGGLSNWQNANTLFVQDLNTSQNSAEIYDPVAGTWSVLAQPMAVARTGHAQLLLSTGMVLVAGGVTGGAFTGLGIGGQGQVPVFTTSCQLFDPVARLFLTTGDLLVARGVFGASTLPDGDVIVTGGAVSGTNYSAAVATSRCERFDPNTNLWTETAPLPEAVCFHSQARSVFNGDAIIMGGFTGDLTSLASSSRAGRHDGTIYVPTLSLGSHALIPGSAGAPRGNLTITPLYDGYSYLVAGGSHTTAHFDTAWLVFER